MILFKVSSKDNRRHVITTAGEREEAKRNAQRQLADNPDHYIVTPLTVEGDEVILKVNGDTQPVVL